MKYKLQILGNSIFIQVPGTTSCFLVRKDGLAGIVKTSVLCNYIGSEGNVVASDFSCTFSKNKYRYRNGYFYCYKPADGKKRQPKSIKETLAFCKTIIENQPETILGERELLVAC